MSLSHTLITTAAPTINIDQGRILGSIGSGGIAVLLTAILIAGTRAGKNGNSSRQLSSHMASVIGVTAGTCYMAAGSIWTTPGTLSDAFASIFTGGAFGSAGLGAVAGVLAAVMYFRDKMGAGWAAIIGIIAAGIWAKAGGIWGIPEALILTLVGVLGAA